MKKFVVPYSIAFSRERLTEAKKMASRWKKTPPTNAHPIIYVRTDDADALREALADLGEFPTATTQPAMATNGPQKTLWDEFFLAVVQALIADQNTKVSQQLIATAGNIANLMMEVRDLKNHALKAEGGGV